MSNVESPRGSIWKTLLGKLGFSALPKVGDQFRFTTPKGDVLTGVVDLVTETRDLALVVREYDDALLRFTLEGKADVLSTFVYSYVIVYGAARERASALVAAASRAVSNG
jgi:hypothetical protein